MAGKKQSQVMDVRGDKGLTSGGESNEILRVAFKGAYAAKMSNAFDPTREHLDFEIQKGKIVPLDKKNSIGKRMRQNIKARGIKDPNEGKDKPYYRTVASFIFGGSQDKMRELAFGEQKVDFEKGADNSSIVRNKAIEDWALDVYNFIARKFGEENIAAFVVHLDETNPHIHCKVLPISEKNKFSWKHVMVGADDSKGAYQKRMIQLHNELYEEVSKKYGLERGEHISETRAKHRTTEEYHAERRRKLQEENIFLESGNAKLKGDNAKLSEDNSKLREENQTLQSSVKQAQIRLKALQTMIANLETQITELQQEVSQLEADRNAGRITAQEYDARRRYLQQDIDYLTEKKYDKEKKLRTAQLQLDELLKKTEDAKKENESTQKNLESIKKQLQRDLPEAGQNVMEDMQRIGFSAAIAESINFIKSFTSVLETSSPEERRILEDKVSPLLDDSFFKEISEQGGNMVQIATNLFLGYIDQATAISESSGGGGGPTSGWGKKDDEDDWKFKQRCFLMGMRMLHHKPQQKQGLKR